MIHRERVFARLDAILEMPAFVVCAGAGSGKTLAVSSWARSRDGFDLAWVNVSAISPDPSDLWSRIVSAIVDAMPNDSTREMLSPALAMNSPQVIPGRILEWAGTRLRPVVVVLDDFDAITDVSQHEQLQRLISSAPPTLHLVMVCRHDPPWPLHRMRLEGSIAEVRGSEMAFTEAEATDLFALLNLNLTEDGVTELVERTKGWAAGLRLAALHLSLSPSPEIALKTISGRSEYISDYLMREVFDELPENWRIFLTTISVVDRISADLATALGASTQSAALLEELARSHTFVHEIGREPGWYRIHPLLLDFLRSRVTDGPPRQSLHRLAAQWFSANDRPWTGLLHAMEAGDHEFAGKLIGKHVVTWAVLQPPRELLRLLETLAPNDLRSDVGLVIGLAASRAMAGRLDDVEELLDQARSLTSLTTGRRRDRYEFLIEVIDVGSSRWRGDLVRLAEGFERVPVDAATLSNLGLADWPTMQALLINNTGAAQMWLGDRTAARGRLVQVARHEPADDLELPVANAQAHLAYLEWEEGNLNEAAELARSVIDRFSDAGLDDAVQAACAHLTMAGVALERNQIVDAERWLERAQPVLREPHVRLAAVVLEARVLAARGQAYEASRSINDLLAALDESDIPPRLTDRARASAAQFIAGGFDDASADDTETTRGRLREELRAASETGAIDAMERALEVAAPHDFRRPFLQQPPLHDVLLRRMEAGTAHPKFASQLLSDMAGTGLESGTGSLRSDLRLTASEANVLRYLATPMSTSEIAEALFVSVNTVKSHQQAIHQKFGVNTRRDAVAMARANDLL